MTTSGKRSSRRIEPEAIGFALYLLMALLPIGASLVYATLYSFGLAGLLSHGPTLEHWRAALTSSELQLSFALSTYVAVSVVVLTASLGLWLSLSLQQNLKRGVLAFAIYLPLALPGTVAAFLCFQCLSGAGLVARLCVATGLISEFTEFPGLVQDRWAFGIVLTHLCLAVPFFTLLYTRLFENERLADLESLAMSLGASRRQILRRVTIPVLLLRSRTNLVLLFIAVLGSYEIPLLLGRQSPQMLSVLQVRKFSLFDLAQKPEAFCVALLYTVTVFGLLVLAFRRGHLVDET